MRTPSDAPRAARTRTGDESRDRPDAVSAEAVAPHVDLLYRDQAAQLIRRLRGQLRSSEDARDLVQDAFARLLGAGKRESLERPEAFLNRIVHNLLIDRSRRLATKAQHLPFDGANEPAVRATQADGLEFAETYARYHASVAKLPDRMRTVFVLHRKDGLSYKEIAARLGISTRTVEWHVAEAIIRIGEDLEQR